jgi:hypothetical protein
MACMVLLLEAAESSIEKETTLTSADFFLANGGMDIDSDETMEIVFGVAFDTGSLIVKVIGIETIDTGFIVADGAAADADATTDDADGGTAPNAGTGAAAAKLCVYLTILKNRKQFAK